MLEYLLIGGAVILFNVLDSVTTELGFRLPEHLRAKESNPLAKPWLEKHPNGFHAFKQLTMIGMVIWLVAVEAIQALVVVAIMLGLVVINNSYILVGRKITKRKINTPFYVACKVCHIHNNLMFVVWVLFTLAVAVPIAYLLF